MSHLPTERLAALTDEPPTSAEVAHLAGCDACAGERAAFAQMRALARQEETRIGAPVTSWESLAPVLRADGIIDTGEWRVSRRPRRFNGWLQTAAAVLLVLGGVAFGRVTAGSAPSAPPIASTTLPTADSATFASAAEARAARARYEQLYQSASLYLAQHDSGEYAPDSPAAMRQRLAALDRVGQTVRQALDDAPYDPVINGYYITTLGQREATLRQLSATLPDGAKMLSF